ncbi:MAG: ABC-F family ATP-binding cassette domain-containing protein [Planctomycetes bacterium]|nr:ABC-F family ATP-binding cassette domain-containing protein [Planctomycetota bacterium]MCB9888421.1 ABC-F family ATP-binding cassette domain-containing protein [Planctomycetota bacterium]
MTLISLDKIERVFGDLVVLDGASLRVEERDRIGIIGDNGAGKTTLIKILAGIDDADRGSRNCQRDLRIGYAAQIPERTPGTTVHEFVLRGNGVFPQLEERIRALEAELAAAPTDERLLAQYGALQGAFEAGGGYDRDHVCDRVLDGLGFSDDDRRKDVIKLSGGEAARAALAALMLQPVDLLILDEPTNHLDLQGIEFVEQFVTKHPGAVVVVSHDRRFLDAVATSIVEVDSGLARRYPGNYSAFAKQTDLELLTTSRAYKDQQEFIQKEMEYIRKHMGSRMTAQAKGRLKRLKRLQLIERPKTSKGEMRLKFTGGRGQSGQSVLEVDDLAAKLPDGRELFRQVGFRLYHGERLGLLGRNGAGKTTLLRILCGRAQPSRGEVRRAHRVRPGVFTQEMEDLPTHGTVLEAMQALDPQATHKELRDHLALFMFSGDEVDQPVANLSGGEKRRLCLARLVRGEYDYLCLDEPTNHLDITAREGLEEALRAYPGAALVISHDRQFLEAITDRVLYLADGRLQTFDGGLEQCLTALHEAELQRKALARDARQAPANQAAGKEQGAARSDKIRNPLLFERLEAEIFGLEEQLEELRAEMERPENYTNFENMRSLEERRALIEADLAAAYAKWENWA